MHLSDLWFIVIAVLWAGYFVLEGFDFGVGILLPLLGRDQTRAPDPDQHHRPDLGRQRGLAADRGRRHLRRLPRLVRDHVQRLLPAAAADPGGLIVRGVAFEYRGKRASAAWRRSWDTAIFVGSLLPAILWGVAFGNVLHGIPLNAAHNYAGNFFTLLNPYSLLGGLATLTLFVLDGALFLALKTMGDLRREAMTTARLSGAAAVVAGGGFLAWTGSATGRPGHVGTGVASVLLASAAAVALLVALAAASGWGLTGEGASPARAWPSAPPRPHRGRHRRAVHRPVPDVLPSTLNTAYTLTVGNASSTAKTLAVMTVVACIFLPFVLMYQGWTYWVFRKRIGAPRSPRRPRNRGHRRHRSRSHRRPAPATRAGQQPTAVS